MNESSLPQKTFKIATLGCRTNQYESQAYQDQLIALGYRPAREDEEADVCIVNTCTVTETADLQSKHDVRQLSKENPQAKIVVTGCAAEQNAQIFASIKGVEHVVLNKEKDQLVQTLFPEEDVPEFSIKNFDAHTRAFVKVQDGCNEFCTYCIIPYVRGRSRSRTIPEIIDEVKDLISNGFKEIVLTGINIGDFDGNPAEGMPPHRLVDLVRAVDQVPGLKRLRISSIDPDEIDDELADAVLNGAKTCHSMHIVLQSGSNVVLKRMNRKYTRQIFLNTIDRLRQADPNFTFTTDIIVGFPGETETDFAETMEIMQEVQFAKVHMFPYSERKRTRAALMPNKVPPDVIKKRKQELLRSAEHQAYLLRERFVGQRMTVLTESGHISRPGEISGHTENFLNVWITGDFQSNELIEVDLVENTPQGLIGKFVRKV
ncbi:putative methylthiotransferase CPn_0477/CP_0277/CPj0477/CpB0496 [Parachlamydia acanthamoebae UV-7]|jgi:threonylcarbamoyladenosine tRNA methylthiotransferase MtaB|uniref:tRNA-2-methylthio-N(6)-dimethylallyladenosine synthase n=2 Tax=Parachlamydia acanthamoebae TaxID=83552 RepID=F8L089_PARAV|nr:tRNA (N(6)-L-threonylcarbamoyladenosine(37)-C(2))-methylthiotransferase MtaB [Parachlamydia acanthamoebae]CCB86619.1 putative methylthiotransferase CPn_0477/CP_0277/CPj0477/CpB0496 [Parachlamydia acanthamoebae UV-7]